MGYVMLFVLDALQEILDFLKLGKDSVVIIVLSQFSADSELIRSFCDLVEVTAKPTEIILVFPVECHHSSKSFYLP
jgi:hypothetical protein